MKNSKKNLALKSKTSNSATFTAEKKITSIDYSYCDNYSFNTNNNSNNIHGYATASTKQPTNYYDNSMSLQNMETQSQSEYFYTYPYQNSSEYNQFNNSSAASQNYSEHSLANNNYFNGDEVFPLDQPIRTNSIDNSLYTAKSPSTVLDLESGTIHKNHGTAHSMVMNGTWEQNDYNNNYSVKYESSDDTVSLTSTTSSGVYDEAFYSYQNNNINTYNQTAALESYQSNYSPSSPNLTNDVHSMNPFFNQCLNISAEASSEMNQNIEYINYSNVNYNNYKNIDYTSTQSPVNNTDASALQAEVVPSATSHVNWQESNQNFYSFEYLQMEQNVY